MNRHFRRPRPIGYQVVHLRAAHIDCLAVNSGPASGALTPFGVLHFSQATPADKGRSGCGTATRARPWGPVQFTTVAATDPKGRVFVPVPLDPDEAWGPKLAHRVAGSVNGMKWRGVIAQIGDGRGIVLGSAWRRDCGIVSGNTVTVELSPEGPQRPELATDIMAALTAEPEAAAFFDALAQFYRRAFLRWIDATKRRPDERAARIAEVVRLCKAGVKERPRV